MSATSLARVYMDINSNNKNYTRSLCMDGTTYKNCESNRRRLDEIQKKKFQLNETRDARERIRSSASLPFCCCGVERLFENVYAVWMTTNEYGGCVPMQ